MRGHPVFIAQHATATCCRGCLAKWHNIPQGVSLSEEQQRYIVAVIYHWLVVQMNPAMRIAENDKIAFLWYLYLPPLLANMLSLYENLLITLR